VAWQLTILLRLSLNPYMRLHLTRHELMIVTPPLWILLLLWIAAAVWLSLYRYAARPSAGTALFRVMESSAVFGVATIVVSFFSRGMGADISRGFVLLFMPVSFVMLTFGRYARLLATWNVERRWPTAERVAVVAHHSLTRSVVERIRQYGGSLAGLVLPMNGEVLGDLAVPVLGSTARLAELINTAQIDRILLLEQYLPAEEVDACTTVAKRMGVVVTRVIGEHDADARAEISEQYGLRLLEMKPVLFTRKQEVAKRTFDAVAAAAMLFLLTPLLIAIAIAVRVTSRGPVLYCSPRVGRGGRHFTFLKFRTMYTGMEDRRTVAALNEKGGHLFKIRRDPRVTPVGRTLRRWSLDELPQLVNVLVGDMSMVGPRPLPASDLAPDGQSNEFCAWAEQRSRVVPGITGLWQIRGRSELPFERMVELDIEYIREWSLALDLRILLETPLVMVTGRGAY